MSPNIYIVSEWGVEINSCSFPDRITMELLIRFFTHDVK